ncbi:DinB family protein [Tamlana sp. 2201CG12-4]|uniref:DinB family protein n=1 Tax=Tamlana sp. 2201CG12-4 TaxID=3112582 RepID=UPI002DB5C80C|nr:DinB family protein [Tamlana sp. 2201CG12-4]MEC3908515.1 DinB family protein [Tamlana sp. 2201CG12-4]
MNIIIQSTLKTLQKSQVLLNLISNEQLCDASVSPYYSSIGSHIRHILDFYDCLFTTNSEGKIDLTARSRNKTVESDCECAQNYLKSVIDQLNTAKFNMNDIVEVIDNLGLGKTEIPYTYGALLAQANSHTIHHYAIINYIFDSLGVTLDDSDFGYNPTTPKQTPTPIN